MKPLITAFAVLLSGLPAFALSQSAEEETKTERIAVEKLKEKLESGERFLLIDVREDRELVEDGAIRGAIHIPMAELEERMKDIPKDIEIVFH